MIISQKMVICAGYLSLGISTPFLSLGMSYMYTSLAAAKAAVISVGEEIATQGLPPEICPLVIVFTGSGNGIIYFNWLTFSKFIVFRATNPQAAHDCFLPIIPTQTFMHDYSYWLIFLVIEIEIVLIHKTFWEK